MLKYLIIYLNMVKKFIILVDMTLFEYKYSESDIVIHKEIIPNKPIVAGVQKSKFLIDNPLPPGLLFDEETGVISGTPSEITAFPYYYRTINVSVGTYDNKEIQLSKRIKITVQNYNFPYNLTYAANDNNEVFILMGIQKRLSPSVKGTVSSFDYYGILSSEFNFNFDSGVISGTCLSEHRDE